MTDAPRGKEITMNVKAVAVIPLAAAAVLILGAGCATVSPDVVVVPPSDHPHQHPGAIPFGDHHLLPYLDRIDSEIGVQILDRFERAESLDLPELRARVTHADGQVEEIMLRGVGYAAALPDDGPEAVSASGASRYATHAEWVREPHGVVVRVWVPVDGHVYQIDFDCERQAPAAEHAAPRGGRPGW
jgi:hypothetical protein